MAYNCLTSTLTNGLVMASTHQAHMPSILLHLFLKAMAIPFMSIAMAFKAVFRNLQVAKLQY